MVLTILFRRLRFFLRTFARTIFAVLPAMVFAGILHHAFKRLKASLCKKRHSITPHFLNNLKR